MRLILVILNALSPKAVKEFAAKMSTSMGTKVPSQIVPLKEWIKKNPHKSDLALATLVTVGDVAVRKTIRENPEAANIPIVKAVIRQMDNAERNLYRSGAQATRDVRRITGDGNSETVHGVSIDQYRETRTAYSESDLLIKKAIGIVGSKTNLLILRDAILSVEAEELANYRT